jgi:electron transfer flavoprotein alpha subunit
MKDVLTYIELLDNEVTDASLQCLVKGREISEKTGGNLHAIIIGSGLNQVENKLAGYGIQSVFKVDNEKLKSYLAVPYKKTVTEIAHNIQAGIILLGATTQGNDLVDSIAAENSYATVLDCTQANFKDSGFILRKIEFDGKVLTSYIPCTGKPVVASLLDGICDSSPSESAEDVQINSHEVAFTDSDFFSSVISREIAKKTVDLKACKTIVTAGAGVGSAQNFKLVEELAKALNGEVGATRPVVDAGWASADRQIGQTGARVKPDLYIACGVSGAVQHRIGMIDSKTIIAINSDQSAPIFKFAHFGITGDLTDVIPKLLKIIKK